MNQIVESGTQEEWLEQLSALASELEPGWESQYGPGSFGCHELLDRVHLLGDMVEGQVLNHPACALHPEWYQLACKATETLRELYQVVGERHLAQSGAGTQGAKKAGS